MKPEDSLDQHMQSGGEIVAPPDMTEFVQYDCLELSGRQAVQNALGYQKHGLEDSKDSGFQTRGRGHHGNSKAQLERRRRSQCGADLEPSPAPGEQDGRETVEPNAQKNREQQVS